VRHPAAVVRDLREERVVVAAEFDAYPCRVGVLDRVGHRFLHDAVDVGLCLGPQLRVEPAPVCPHAQFGIDTEGGRCTAAQRLKSRPQPELVEGGRAKLRDQVSQRRDLVTDKAPRLADGRLHGAGAVAGSCRGQHDLHGTQLLERVVVQLTGPASSLPFFAVAAGLAPLPLETVAAQSRTVSERGGAGNQRERHEVQTVDQRIVHDVDQ
jgi:hypothetical protein